MAQKYIQTEVVPLLCTSPRAHKFFIHVSLYRSHFYSYINPLYSASNSFTSSWLNGSADQFSYDNLRKNKLKFEYLTGLSSVERFYLIMECIHPYLEFIPCFLFVFSFHIILHYEIKILVELIQI